MTESTFLNLATEYTDHFDRVFTSLADYAMNDHADHIHLLWFASQYVGEAGGQQQEISNIVHECQLLLQSFGWLQGWDASISFKIKQIDGLREARARWDAFARIEITDRQRLLLQVLTHESIALSAPMIITEYVSVETILINEELGVAFPNMTKDLLIEELDDLADRRLCEAHKTIGLTEYRATYGGTTWLSKAHVLDDREIDDLRTQGEHDQLDYKRIYTIKSRSDKAEFTKDVLSFANSGGSVSRILVGVEDNGTFPTSPDPDEHVQTLRALVDTTLQAIVSERTVVPPSIMVTHGQHREGPYVLITIKSNTADTPYRFFANPSDSRLPGASQEGEVWVRHGTSKRRATADEIEAMVKRAALHRSLFP